MILTEGKTIQQVSDEIAKALIKQGKRCYSSAVGGCVFSDGEGNYCAIGLVLPEDDEKIIRFIGGLSDLLETFGSENLGPNGAFIKKNLTTFYSFLGLHDNQLRKNREVVADNLISKGIDITAWQPWIEMGK